MANNRDRAAYVYAHQAEEAMLEAIVKQRHPSDFRVDHRLCGS